MMFSDNELNELKNIALKKKELLENIYDITSKHKFYGEESEVEAFVEYLDVREPYYEQLAELDNGTGAKLKNFKTDFGSKSGLYREVSQIVTNAQDVAALIVALDKENNMAMDKVYKSLMSKMRNISANKKARASYNFFQVQGGGKNSVE